jgi:hypothetical protein
LPLACNANELFFLPTFIQNMPAAKLNIAVAAISHRPVSSFSIGLASIKFSIASYKISKP